jgi:hypothetical protein
LACWTSPFPHHCLVTLCHWTLWVSRCPLNRIPNFSALEKQKDKCRKRPIPSWGKSNLASPCWKGFAWPILSASPRGVPPFVFCLCFFF